MSLRAAPTAAAGSLRCATAGCASLSLSLACCAPAGTPLTAVAAAMSLRAPAPFCRPRRCQQHGQPAGATRLFGAHAASRAAVEGGIGGSDGKSQPGTGRAPGNHRSTVPDRIPTVRGGGRSLARPSRAELAALAAHEEVVLPTPTTPRELALPRYPEGLVHWTPKPAPPRVITTPHLDAKLPEKPTRLQRQLKWALFGTSIFAIWGVGMVFTDNYAKLKSSIVDGVLFMIKNDPVAKSVLGPHIRFANKHLPWISGTLQQVKGLVDVSFTVKGELGTGVVRFFARRKLSKDNRPGEWVTLEFSLTLPSGEKLDISQTPEVSLEEEGEGMLQ